MLAVLQMDRLASDNPDYQEARLSPEPPLVHRRDRMDAFCLLAGRVLCPGALPGEGVRPV